MAINAGTIMAYLDMDTSGFTSAFDTAAAQLSGFTDGGINGALSSIGSAAASAGRALSLGVSAPLLAVGTAAVNTGKEFDAQMSRVQAIAGATDEEFRGLRDTAIGLGATTTFSALEAAQGMENLASAGFDAAQITAAMPGMLDLAAASGEGLALSAGIAASTLRGFGLEASQAGHVADVLAANAARTNAAVADTGEAMKYVAPLANTMGLSLEEVTAAIGIMSDAGIMGGQAGTTLRGALSRLAKPTEDMAMVMGDLGLEFYHSNGEMKSLREIVGMLDTQMAGLTDEQRQNALVTLFGQEALSGMMVLMDAGEERLGSLTQAYENCDGAAAEMAQTMTDNLQGDLEGLGGALESASISLSDFLTPALRMGVQGLTGIVDGFNGLARPVKDAVFQFGTVAAAIGPVLMVAGKLIKAFTMLTNPIGLVAGGLALAYRHSDVLQGAVASLGEGFSTFYTTLEGGAGILEALRAGLTRIIGEDAMAALTGFISNIQGGFELIGSAVETIATGIGTFIGSLIDGDGLVGAWNAATAAISAFDWAGLGQTMYSGVTAAFDMAGNWLSSLFSAGMAAVTAIDWHSVGTAIRSGVMTMIDTAGAWLASLFGFGKTAAEGIDWSGIGTAILNGIGTILDSAGAFLSGLFGFGKTAAEGIDWSGIGTAILGGVTGVLDIAGGFLSGLFTAGKDAVTAVDWGSVGTTILNGVTGVLDIAGGFLSGLFTAGKDAVTAVDWGSVGTTILNGVTGVLDTAGTFLSGAFTAAKTTIEGIEWGSVGSAISTGLSGAIDTLGKIGSSIWDTITGWFDGDDENSAQEDAEAMMTGLETGITENAGTVAAAASTAATGISTAVTNVLSLEGGTTTTTTWMTGLGTGITTAQTTLTTDAQTAAEAVTAAADTELSSINGSTTTTTWMTGLSTGITTEQTTLTTDAQTAAEAATSAASDEMSYTNGWMIGVNLTHGMAAGVRSGSSALTSAVRTVARAAVAAAKTALKINSPSRVFADDIGAWIPSGIGLGVARNAQDALGPIEELRGSMMSMFDGTILGVSAGKMKIPWESGAYAARDTTVNINVNGDWTVRSDDDQREIIDELTRIVEEELRRR